jgi:hypothetical protein
MIRLTRITTEQLEWYRKVTGSFYGMDFTFGGPAGLFGFYGEFDISSEGEVDLANLLVAHSCEHGRDEMMAKIRALRQAIINSQWSAALCQENRINANWEEFELEFFSEPTRDGTVATHLLLSHDDPAIFRKPYFDSYFELRSDLTRQESVQQTPGGYYPVSPARAPEQTEIVDVVELARRIRGKPLVAFTGAGLSLAAGIPTFEGKGGLQEQFPIDDYRFPGAVAGRMIHRPRETALILGKFYTRFMTAYPTQAHTALAELEENGRLKHIITGNFDNLHERAGSRKVHINEPKYFKSSDEGWAWIQEGQVALVTGVSMDADNGLLDYARDNGLQIAVIDPGRPSFMHAKDWFIEGLSEDILPELTRLLLTT